MSNRAMLLWLGIIFLSETGVNAETIAADDSISSLDKAIQSTVITEAPFKIKVQKVKASGAKLYQASRLLRNAKYREAALVYSEIINEDTSELDKVGIPDKQLAYVNRGDCYKSLKIYPAAIADYSKGLALSKSVDAQTYAKRAAVYRLIGNISAAEQDEKKVQALNPKEAEVFLELFRIVPSKAEDYRKRAYLFINTGNFDSAVSDFQKCFGESSNTVGGAETPAVDILEVRVAASGKTLANLFDRRDAVVEAEEYSRKHFVRTQTRLRELKEEQALRRKEKHDEFNRRKANADMDYMNVMNSASDVSTQIRNNRKKDALKYWLLDVNVYEKNIAKLQAAQSEQVSAQAELDAFHQMLSSEKIAFEDKALDELIPVVLDAGYATLRWRRDQLDSLNASMKISIEVFRQRGLLEDLATKAKRTSNRFLQTINLDDLNNAESISVRAKDYKQCLSSIQSTLNGVKQIQNDNSVNKSKTSPYNYNEFVVSISDKLIESKSTLKELAASLSERIDKSEKRLSSANQSIESINSQSEAKLALKKSTLELETVLHRIEKNVNSVDGQ